MAQAGSTSKLQLNELEELCNEAYKNAYIYKTKAKAFHDKHINRITFEPNQKVWLFIAKLQLFSCKFRSRCDGPFIVTQVFLHGAVEIQNLTNGNTFKVNGKEWNILWKTLLMRS